MRDLWWRIKAWFQWRWRPVRGLLPWVHLDLRHSAGDGAMWTDALDYWWERCDVCGRFRPWKYQYHEVYLEESGGWWFCCETCWKTRKVQDDA